MVTTNNQGFTGTRSSLYEEAIVQYPSARIMDVQAMTKHLNPQKNEKVLGIGEGNGFFALPILEAIGEKGYYLVIEPSPEQLANLARRVTSPNLETLTKGIEDFTPTTYFDKAWYFGAFHHCPNQTQAMKNIYNALTKGGKMVICYVFQGSNLARHFDGPVARYCTSVHEVKFLSKEFAKSLCYLAGFDESKVRIVDLPQKWKFDSEKDLGDFVYKLHAMTLIPGNEQDKIEEVIKGCKEILGVKKVGNQYELNWPMKALIAEK